MAATKEWQGEYTIVTRIKLPVAANAVCLKGTSATLRTTTAAAGYVGPASAATGQKPVGRFAGSVDNTGGANGAKKVEVELAREIKVFWWVNDSSSPVTAAMRGQGCWFKDNNTVSSDATARSLAGRVLLFRSDLGLTGDLVGVEMDEAPVAAGDAEDVAIADGGGKYTSTDVEGALAEAATTAEVLAIPSSVAFPLTAFRLVDANGDVGDTAANGGVPSSETEPTLLGAATTEHMQLVWSADEVGAIACQMPLPADFDDDEDATLELDVASGTTDAASFVVGTSWNGGAIVADAANDTATKSATPHQVDVTIAAGDIPASARYVTLTLTPPAHSTNAIILQNVRMLYQRKLA